MRRYQIELGIGLFLDLAFIVWIITHWHQHSTRPGDCMVVLCIVGLFLMLHASYQIAFLKSR